jgi:hypothetical protein
MQASESQGSGGASPWNIDLNRSLIPILYSKGREDVLSEAAGHEDVWGACRNRSNIPNHGTPCGLGGGVALLSGKEPMEPIGQETEWAPEPV